MIEPQPPIAAVPIEKISESTETSTALSFAEIDFETISKTIVKLTDWAAWEFNTDSAINFSGQDLSNVPNSYLYSEASPILFEAWESLVKIVAHLLSTASGWSSDLPRTPDNIATYVTEEACEVLDAIEAQILSENLEVRSKTQLNNLVPSYILIKELIPRLLWYIARTSDDLIRLLTGVEARVFQLEKGWSKGILRLTVILTLDNLVAPWSIDLATNQPPRSHLNSDSLIQWNDCYYAQSPIESEKLIQQFFKRIQEVNPEILTFTEQTKVDFLEPEKDWQSGKLQLCFDWEFIPDSETKMNTQIAQISELSHHSLANILELNAGFESDLYSDNYFKYISVSGIQLKITNLENIELYYLTTVQEQLASFIEELLSVDLGNIQDGQLNELEVLILDLPDRSSDDDLEKLEDENETKNLADKTSDLKTENLVLSVVTSACEVAKRFQQGMELSEVNARSPQMWMADLTLKLVWDIIRSSYEVMKILGGVKAQVLQPGGDWQTGTLCLVAILQVDAGHNRGHIDVVTGQLRNSNTKLLVSKAIATSQESDLCKAPVEIGSLAKRIIRKLRESSPEIAFWMDGIGVELRSATANSADLLQTNWQSGAIKLSIGFELLEQDSIHI